MSVFVLDQRHRALMPCSEKRARLLLARGRALVHQGVPFTENGKYELPDLVVGGCMASGWGPCLGVLFVVDWF